MPMTTITLNNATETKNLGQKIAHSLANKPSLIFLCGDLGAGKTTFAQGFIKELTKDETVVSPTYAYMHTYHGALTIYHFDLYRIDDPEQIFALGLIDFIEEDTAIRLIEWPERLNNAIVPEITIELKKLGSKRQAVITSRDIPLWVA
jgi:tRNA threonylcarbamoyladenosine biosynthesis protein TsaE